MKTIGKFLAINIFILVLLGSGLYFVLNNLGSMLAADHNGLKCRWINAGVEIKTGGRIENIRLKFPVNISHRSGQWEIKSGRHSITIDTVPRIHIRWQ